VAELISALVFGVEGPPFELQSGQRKEHQLISFCVWPCLLEPQSWKIVPPVKVIQSGSCMVYPDE
jgi:hypothetical protein